MSDENKNDKDTNESTKKSSGWAQWAFPWVDPAASLYQALKDEDKTQYKNVIDLAPGDIIRVAHVTIFVVGVRFHEFVNPSTERREFSVQVAGAEADWFGEDWHWRSSDILYASPFLRFHPEHKVILEQPSRSEESALDKFIAFRQKARDKEEERKREAAETKKKMRLWADKISREGKNAHTTEDWGGEEKHKQTEEASSEAAESSMPSVEGPNQTQNT